MTDVAVRQAGRAVMLDPTEHSAHSFLAYSTDLVRDPRKVNLRYETPTLSEYLMANLLGSAEDTILSPSTARGSTDRLLKADGFQFVSATEYRDSGEWREAGALSLTEQGTSLAVDTILRRDPGLRPNEDLDESEVNFRWRQQLSDRDTLFMEAQTYRAIGGDLNQYENPSEDFNPTYRSEERQDPIITAGFHRKWSDNQHTLLLFNHLQDRFSVMNHYQEAVIVSTDSSNVILGADPISREQSYESRLQIESGEAQHIIRRGRGVLTLGARFQGGSNLTKNANGQLTAGDPVFSGFIGEDAQNIEEAFNRQAGYAYWNLELTDTLTAASGLTYDRVQYPENFRAAPISSGTETRQSWLPKAGLQWNPQPSTHLGVGYGQSLAGASIDQSYRLEPTQIAGILTTYRSLIPESLGGSTTGEKFETLGGYVEHTLSSQTRLATEVHWLRSASKRTIGAYELSNASLGGVFELTTLREDIDFDETKVALTVHQPVGQNWIGNLRYNFAHAEMKRAYPSLPANVLQISDQPLPSRKYLESQLHTLGLGFSYRNPSGFFGRWENIFHYQQNENSTSESTSRHPWQMNAEAGWQFLQRRLEFAVGVLNATDNDFRLNPLNYHLDPPRERICYSRLTLSF